MFMFMFMNYLGDIAASQVRWVHLCSCTMQLLSVTVQGGNAEMYSRSGSGLVIQHEQGVDASAVHTC